MITQTPRAKLCVLDRESYKTFRGDIITFLTSLTLFTCRLWQPDYILC